MPKGVYKHKRGYKFSEGHKQKISLANKKEWIKIKCNFCRKVFRVYPYRKNTAKFCSFKCLGNDKIGKHHSIEHRNKISKSNKGRVCWLKGKHHTEETKRKISKALKGRIISKENRIKLSNFHTGKKLSEKTKQKLSGKNASNWKGGISPLTVLLRANTKYINWRIEVYTHDNYICQICKVKNKDNKYLNAHHIIPFYSILNEIRYAYKDGLTYKNALKYNFLWDIKNGITVCEKCHYPLHFKNANHKT